MKTAARTYAVVAQSVVLVLVTLAGLAVVAVLVGVRPPNPFATHEVAREHGVSLERLQNVSQYTAASQHLQTVIDVEDKSDYLPSAIKGERVVFVAEGDVEARVDFSTLPSDAVQPSADGTSVTVHLPEPQLTVPRVDPHKSSVVARDRGLLDRANAAISGSDPVSDQKYYELAEKKLADAADQSELRDRGRSNTETFVRDLFTKAGYTQVTVVFDQPAPGSQTA